MNSSKIYYLVAFILFTYFSLQFFQSAFIGREIATNGIKVETRVVQLPTCGRGNGNMNIVYKDKFYNIKIGKNDCIQGKYRIGDEVEALYSISYDKIQLATEKVNFNYVVSILFFLVPLFCLFKLLKKNKN